MTSKLTREQLHERARDNVKALKMASRQTAFESVREEILADLQLAELALAAMDSEPVAFTEKHEISNMHATGLYLRAWPADRARNAVEGYTIPLYLHAQPVVPDGLVKAVEFYEQVKRENPPVETGAWKDAVDWVLKEACRAAMLQELKKSAGTEATCRSNENAQVLTSINPAPDLVSLPKNAKSLTGNSPVIPDGYVMVPKEPTESMVIAGFESEPDEFFSESEVWEAYQKMSGCEQAAFRARLCWTAMLAAAPQEVKGE